MPSASSTSPVTSLSSMSAASSRARLACSKPAGNSNLAKWASERTEWARARRSAVSPWLSRRKSSRGPRSMSAFSHDPPVTRLLVKASTASPHARSSWAARATSTARISRSSA